MTGFSQYLVEEYHGLNKTRAKKGVKRPSIMDAGCWGEKRVYSGSLFAAFHNCGCKPRKGFLTCRHHADREADAQKLKADLAAQGDTRKYDPY